MLAAQLSVRTVSGFSRTSVSNSLGSYPWQLSRQICFPTQRCRSFACKSSRDSFDGYNQDILVPDMWTTTGPKEAISKISAKRKHFSEDFDMDHERVLAERNQLRDELAQKTKEIEKLQATIHSALHHLSVAVHYPNEIPATSMHEQNITNSAEDNPLKRKPDEFDDGDQPSNKKQHLESNNDLIHDTVYNYYDTT